MLVVLAGAAEMERNLTRERTRSTMAVKRANGQRVGAVPYGFDLADDGELAGATKNLRGRRVENGDPKRENVEPLRIIPFPKREVS